MGVLFSYFRLSLSQPVYFHLGGEEDMCLMGGAGPRLGRDEMGEMRWERGGRLNGVQGRGSVSRK